MTLFDVERGRRESSRVDPAAGGALSTAKTEKDESIYSRDTVSGPVRQDSWWFSRFCKTITRRFNHFKRLRHAHEEMSDVNCSPADDPGLGGVQHPSAGVQPKVGATKSQASYTAAENEDACGKLWSIYVGEAERYDKRLVESWKDDMDGMLIFSGLYSASLTAFIVESYKTLQPDSGDIAVTLLSKISLQLAAASSGTEEPSVSGTPFQPTTAALICNTLWFLSLALSLTCAILATLIKQWARDFLHKTEMRPSPVRRARIFSFLYFGLKRFRMHTLVDAIPMLLHLSLLFFFAGLIGFLLPVNRILVYFLSGVLVVFLVLYTTLTILPVIFLDCPYRTPLSDPLWHVYQAFRTIISASHSSVDPTASHSDLTEAVILRSFEKTDTRDERAVEWTVASLTDDSEFLPLVEAIPDAICGPNGFHESNYHLLSPVIQSVDIHLSIGARIINLLRRSDSLLLDDALRTRRQNACLKAIWALAMTSSAQERQTLPVTPFGRGTLDALKMRGLDRHYSVSAYAAVRYSRMTRLKVSIEGINRYLQDCPITSETLRTTQDMVHAVTQDHIEWSPHLWKDSFRALNEAFPVHNKPIDRNMISHVIEFVDEAVKALTADSRWTAARLEIVAEFLELSMEFKACPHEFLSTCEEIIPDITEIGYSEQTCLYMLFIKLLHYPMDAFSSSSTTAVCDFDRIVRIMMRLFPLISDPLYQWHSMESIYRYISTRNSDEAIIYILKDCDVTHLQRCIIHNVPEVRRHSKMCLEAIWILGELMSRNEQLLSSGTIYEFARRLLLILPDHDFLPSHPSHRFATALMSWISLQELDNKLTRIIPKRSRGTRLPEDSLVKLSEITTHPLLLDHFPDSLHLTEHSALEVCGTLDNQITTIHFTVLSQFLSACAADRPLRNSAQALKTLIKEKIYSYAGPVSTEHQHGFAEAVLNLVQMLKEMPGDFELTKMIAEIWDLSYLWDWIDSKLCATSLTEAIHLYLGIKAVEKGREDDPRSPTSNAKRLLSRCHEITQSTSQTCFR